MRLNTPLTLKEAAELTNSEFTGAPHLLITGINEIHMVSQGDITFVDNEKYYNKALNSAATFIIINKKIECPAGKALLFNEDPFNAYVLLVKKFKPFIPASAIINTSAKIGEGSIIQPGAFIGNNVKIGKHCLIHANVSIYDETIIGDNVIIHSGTVIGADAFYFKRRNWGYDKMVSCGKVVIKDNVEIGACCTIDRGVSGDTIIGSGTKFDNHIQIGHDTEIGMNCLFASHVAVAGVVKVEDNVILWGQVGVQKDLVIGEGAVVLGQSGISKSLKGGITYFGSPVQEAKTKMKELALIKSLPDIMKKLK